MEQIESHFFLKRFGFHVKFLLVAVIATSTTDAVTFRCVFGFDSLTPIERVYTCVANVTFSGSAALENVTGVHQPELSIDDVEFLYIGYQNLPLLPEGIGLFFKNLRALLFQDTGMLSISAADLQPFPQLEVLIMWGNNLTSLDGDLFSFTPLMKYIDLRYNQIQHIGQDLVTSLNNLECLALQGNVCIDLNFLPHENIATYAPPQLALCSSLDSTTTTVTTTTATTTEVPIEKCSCVDVIDELHEENQRLNKDIIKLQQSNDQLTEVFSFKLLIIMIFLFINIFFTIFCLCYQVFWRT